MSRQKPKQTKTSRRADGQLRLIGGQWRGRKLAIADVDGLRPTGDRIRETLFNWLMPYIGDSHCLDLFAGTGALGLESLSRGARQVVMIEQHTAAIGQLRENCRKLGCTNAEIIQADTLAWLMTGHSLEQHSVDIVFMDPPFAADLWETAAQQLVDSQLLAPEALIYIETPKDRQLRLPATWQLLKEKPAGNICYRLYQSAAVSP